MFFNSKFFKWCIFSLLLFNLLGYGAFLYMYSFYKKDYWTALLMDFPSANYKESRRKLLPYAIDGDLNARYYLGKMYALGQGVPVNETTATEWFNCDNKQSCIPGRAEFFIGIELLTSTSINKNRGFCWLKKSVEKGFPYALILLNK